MQQWFDSAAKGDTQYIQQNVNQCAKQKDSSGRTALMYAASKSYNDIVQILAPHEACMQQSDGYTALMMGIINGNSQILQLLPNEINIKTSNNTTSLMIAVASNFQNIQPLLQLQKQFNANGHSAYMLAVMQNNQQAMQLLNQEELIVAPNGVTPLMIAAGAANIDLVKQIIQKCGGMVMRQDYCGKSACRYAFDALCNNDDQDDQNILIEIIEILKQEYSLTADDKTTTLMLAANQGLINIVEQMKDSQQKLQNNEKMTALMWAAKNSQLDAIELLAEAEINMQDSEGRTACMYTTEQGEYDAFNLLVEEEYETYDNQQRNVMHYACIHNSPDIAGSIIDTFAGVADSNGVTSLMEAARNGSIDCVKILGRELMLKDAQGWTALHYAAEKDKPRCLRALQRLNTEKTLLDETALDIAIKNDSCKAVPILLALTPNSTALFDAARLNKWRVCKAICDIGRTCACELCPKADYTAKEVDACKKQIKLLTTKYMKVPDDYSALHLAVLYDSFEAIRVLAPVFCKSCSREGLSALMLFVQKEVVLKEPDMVKFANMQKQMKLARNAIIQQCAGMQTIKPLGNLDVGITALMLGIMKMGEINNSETLKMLYKFEKDITTKQGYDCEYFAEQVGKLAEVQQWNSE